MNNKSSQGISWTGGGRRSARSGLDMTGQDFQRSLSCFERRRFSRALAFVDSAIQGCTNPPPSFLVLKARILFDGRLKEKDAIDLMKGVANRVASSRVEKVLMAKALYYVGLWSFLTEDEVTGITYLKRYLRMAESHPSLRLPTQYAIKNLRAVEAALMDPNYETTSALVNERRFSEALKHIEVIIGHAGVNMSDHWILALGAQACHATGMRHKAYTYSRQAFHIEPRCPDTALIYGVVRGCCRAMQLVSEGERVLKWISRMKIADLSSGRCGQGNLHAQQLKLTSLRCLGLLYGKQGRFLLARKYFYRYLETSKRYALGQADGDDEIRRLMSAVADECSEAKKECREKLERMFE